MQINNTLTLDNEVVLVERKTTTEFRITDVHESITNKFVRAEVELGPFISETLPNGQTEIKGQGGRRVITVWDNDTYDAVRDTWTNADLLAAVKVNLEN